MDEGNEKIYKDIGKVYCPYFKDYINFTRVGFEHLNFKNKYRARPAKDRNMRFKLLPLAVQILSLSHTLQNISSRNRFEERTVNNRRETALMLVIYYEFIAIISQKRMKIIIKQIESRDKIFLSVIPFFKQKTPPEEGDGFS
ncbi:MAG: hypothetical protein AAB917_01045 [Patescibacteria group bacterium]